MSWRAAPRVSEGGWLNFTPKELEERAIEAREAGFRGFKVKVGRAHVSEDVTRLAAVRLALGPEFEMMVDANQCFTVSEAIRRARRFEDFDLAWFEEPMPAEDLDGHVRFVAIDIFTDCNRRVVIPHVAFSGIFTTWRMLDRAG